MMKRIFLLVLAGFFCNVGSAEPAVVSALELQIERVLPTGQITVSAQNRGNEPLRMWRGGNEWGVARWRIVHISNGRLQIYYQNPHQIFTVTSPLFNELSAAKSVQITLNLNDGFWLPKPKDVKWTSGDTVIAIYDVPASDEAEKYDVWYGVIAAMAVIP